jgi:hypothetical protein
MSNTPKTNLIPYTLNVFPAGYTGALGYFETSKNGESGREIRITNSMEHRRLVRGHTIPVFNLVGLKINELDPELLATIQLCSASWTSQTGVLQQYFEIEIDEVDAGKVVKPRKDKRDIIHLTVDKEMDFSTADLQFMAELFKDASLQEDGAVVITQSGIRAEVLTISEGAELRLVSAHVQSDVVYELLEQGTEPQSLVIAGEREEPTEENESDEKGENAE